MCPGSAIVSIANGPTCSASPGIEDEIGARGAVPAEALLRAVAHDLLGGLAARDALRRAAAHDRRHAREGGDPAHVIPVGVRDQQAAHLEAARRDVGRDRRYLGRRDARIDEHRLAAGVQSQRGRLPERALVADHAWAQIDRGHAFRIRDPRLRPGTRGAILTR